MEIYNKMSFSVYLKQFLFKNGEYGKQRLPVV